MSKYKKKLNLEKQIFDFEPIDFNYDIPSLDYDIPSLEEAGIDTDWLYDMQKELNSEDK